MRRNDFLKGFALLIGWPLGISANKVGNDFSENSKTILQVDTIEELKKLSGKICQSCIVNDVNRGGHFTYKRATEKLQNDNGIIFSGADGGYWQRIYSGYVNVKWFDAVGDGKKDDTLALKNAIKYSKLKAFQTTLYLPGGVYLITDAIILDGGLKEVNAPILRGDGARNTVLDFSKSTKSKCVKFGSPESNTHYGGVFGLTIKGNGIQDALTISSSAPYTASFNKFEDLRIYNVKNGIIFEMIRSNTTSCFCNKFKNIQIEKYYGIGLHAQGSYNAYDGFSISQPGGITNVNFPDRNFGANSLALLAQGASDLFNNFQTEDQVKIEGYACSVNNLTIEHILKGASNLGGSAIVVAGQFSVMTNVLLIGFNNDVIKYIGSVFSQNNMLQNWRYIGIIDSKNKILYPIILNKKSSGTAMNIQIQTTYSIDTPELLQNLKDWVFINVSAKNGLMKTTTT